MGITIIHQAVTIIIPLRRQVAARIIPNRNAVFVWEVENVKVHQILLEGGINHVMVQGNVMRVMARVFTLIITAVQDVKSVVAPKNVRLVMAQVNAKNVMERGRLL